MGAGGRRTQLHQHLVGVLAEGGGGTHGELLARHDDRIAEREDVAEDRMLLDDDADGVTAGADRRRPRRSGVWARARSRTRQRPSSTRLASWSGTPAGSRGAARRRRRESTTRSVRCSASGPRRPNAVHQCAQNFASIAQTACTCRRRSRRPGTGRLAGPFPRPAPVDELGLNLADGIEPLAEHGVGRRHVEKAASPVSRARARRTHPPERGVQRTDHDAAAAHRHNRSRPVALAVERHQRRATAERVHHLPMRRHVRIRTGRGTRSPGSTRCRDGWRRTDSSSSPSLRFVSPMLPVMKMSARSSRRVSARDLPGRRAVAGEAALVAVEQRDGTSTSRGRTWS